MEKEDFLSFLKRKGYDVTTKKLGGGYVNDVQLVSAYKKGEVFEFVLKKYKSEEEFNNMLSGYDKLAKFVKTPAITYLNKDKKEVVYDVLKGKSVKDMILNHDKEAPKALVLLAKELEKIHRIKSPADWAYGNSPDERRMLNHILVALKNKQINKKDAENLFSKIQKYVPKVKSIIHGDAHLGNFVYSDKKVYFIDPDSAKISDYNADIGKVIGSIRELEDTGKINVSEADMLEEMFLTVYEGEDEHALKLYKMRTLLNLLRKPSSHQGKFLERFKQLSKSLETRVAVAIVAVAFGALLISGENITGRFIQQIIQIQNPFYLLPIFSLLLVVIIIALLFIRKRKFV